LPLVVDDHHLVDLLAETTSGWLRSELDRSAIYTTSSWYYRVASAARRGSNEGRSRADSPLCQSTCGASGSTNRPTG